MMNSLWVKVTIRPFTTQDDRFIIKVSLKFLLLKAVDLLFILPTHFHTFNTMFLFIRHQFIANVTAGEDFTLSLPC